MAPIEDKSAYSKSSNSLWVGFKWVKVIVQNLVLNSQYLFLCGSILILLEAAVLVVIICYVPCELITSTS